MIFDCFSYLDEDLLLDVRLNILNDYVEKFVICESIYDHKGRKKNLNFKAEKFKDFKDKNNIYTTVVISTLDWLKNN